MWFNACRHQLKRPRVSPNGAYQPVVKLRLHSAGDASPLTALLLPQIFPIIPDILGRRALSAGRLAALGATPEFHHGLLGQAPLSAWNWLSASNSLIDRNRRKIWLDLDSQNGVLGARTAESAGIHRNRNVFKRLLPMTLVAIHLLILSAQRRQVSQPTAQEGELRHEELRIFVDAR
jgi:hypothetical protein